MRTWRQSNRGTPAIAAEAVILSLAVGAGCSVPCADGNESASCPSVEDSGTTAADPTPTTTSDSTGAEPDTSTGTGTETAPTCTDEIHNGDETDVDCGGSCPEPCDDGEGCVEEADCSSMICGEDMVCLPVPTCEDGVQNGDETGTDCGNSCPQCPTGEGCDDVQDCVTGLCQVGICVDPSCTDGIEDGDETDVDCGGMDCAPCEDGQKCEYDGDCISQMCNLLNNRCIYCADGISNGEETGVDCGGDCPACGPGEGCVSDTDCVSELCIDDVCGEVLSVGVTPSCSLYAGAPISLTANGMGGLGMYSYAWSPDDGTVSDPALAMTDVDPGGFGRYDVTVDDGDDMATGSAVVILPEALDLQTCTLYERDFSMASGPPTISYDMGGTRACELGNNDFGLHLCESFAFKDTRIVTSLEVTDAAGDDDMVGVVWGAQDNHSNFYSLTWKAVPQNFFGCEVPVGIVVKRVDAPSLELMTGADVFCPSDTLQSELMLDPAGTTVEPWVAGETYIITIEHGASDSMVTVERQSDMVQIASFAFADTNYSVGQFGSIVFSQANACIGPVTAECM